MNRLKLTYDDKKEIVLDALRNRPQSLETESITSFIARLLHEYNYGKGTERYFWVAVRQLENEGKIRKFKNGKRKNIFLQKGKYTTKRPGEKMIYREKRLKVLKDFLRCWSYDTPVKIVNR